MYAYICILMYAYENICIIFYFSTQLQRSTEFAFRRILYVYIRIGVTIYVSYSNLCDYICICIYIQTESNLLLSIIHRHILMHTNKFTCIQRNSYIFI